MTKNKVQVLLCAPLFPGKTRDFGATDTVLTQEMSESGADTDKTVKFPKRIKHRGKVLAVIYGKKRKDVAAAVEEFVVQTRSSRLSVGLIIALIIILVLQPTLYTLLRPRNFDTTTRTYWWLATGWVLVSIWLPFGILCWVVHYGKYKWQDVAGVDWHFFSRHRVVCAALLALFVIGAVISPRLLYYGNPPRISPTSIFQPVSCAERVVFLVVAVSAGICEEVTYRGLPLRMLASSTGRAWAVLPVTMVSFAYHHGPIGHAAFVFLSVGFVFGSIFILQGRRHLEWLIILHAFYDAMFVFMP